MRTKNTYIIQNMKLFSDYNLLQEINEDPWKEYYNKSIRETTIDELFKVDRLMVIAEPGYGKTRLLKEIVLRSKSNYLTAYFIDAKKILTTDINDTLKRCKPVASTTLSEEQLQDKRLFSNNESVKLDKNTLICIDALDEVPFHLLSELLENIEFFLNENPRIKLFLSCRTHHLKKIDYDLPRLKLQFLQLYPFTGQQIGQYLNQDISEIYRKTKVKDLLDFIAIPRYLYYFSQLLRTSSIEAISSLSRQQLFENFIYRKLDKERGNSHHSETDLLKRVLEKLALIMKIHHVSEISKDELMSIFDNLESTFSQIIFRDDLLNKLYDRSVLKDNIDSIEFENQEFLDYLAAKEISRFQNAEQAFYDFAIEPISGEIFTPWFYVLPFLLEIVPNMIDNMLDFVLNNSTKVIRSEYFEVLTSLETDHLNEEQKRNIFNTVFDYYTQHRNWLISIGHDMADRLARYYLPEHYSKILDSISDELDSTTLYVTRSNAVELIAALLEHGKISSASTIEEWKERLTSWLRYDTIKHQVLHRHILMELASFAQNDFEWIKSLYFIFENGIQTQHPYARACFKVAPEEHFSIDVYLCAEEYFNNNKHERNLSSGEPDFKYIFYLQTCDAFVYALSSFLRDDENAHNNLQILVHGYIPESDLKAFSKNLLRAWSNKLTPVVSTLIFRFITEEHRAGYTEQEDIFQILINILFEKEPNILCSFVDQILLLCKENNFFVYVAAHILSEYVLKNTPNGYLPDLLKHIQPFEYFDKVLVDFLQDKSSPKDASEYIQSHFSDVIKKYQTQLTNGQFHPENDVSYLCDEWQKHLEPEPNKYMLALFHFYLSHKEKLINCENYKTYHVQTVQLASNLVKNYNPLEGRIESQDNHSTIWGVRNYSDAIKLLSEENTSLDQEIQDNIFRYLPFAINSSYEEIFNAAKSPSSNAVQDVIDVYKGKRDDDLKYYHPINLLEAYELFHWPEAEPILMSLFEDEKINEWERKKIVESLPLNIMTPEKIRQYIQQYRQNKTIYDALLCILIREYQDNDAIQTGLENVTFQALRLLKYDESKLHDIAHGQGFERFPIAFALTYTHYELRHDKGLLILAAKLYKKGRKKIAHFFHKMVTRHLEYLKEDKSFSPILEIERFIAEKKTEYPELHWFEFELEGLKKSYLETLGQPKNILDAVHKYNLLKANEYLPITSSAQLAELLKRILLTDTKRWIEKEGAYKSIQMLAQKEKKLEAEDFIQKGIKAQIELALLRHGIRESDYKVSREEQLLDDKRIDITVSYGFIGSVVIEIKLSHNPESNASTNIGKSYIDKFRQYLDGIHSTHGIFLIFNIRQPEDKFQDQLVKLQHLYSKTGIDVVGLHC